MFSRDKKLPPANHRRWGVDLLSIIVLSIIDLRVRRRVLEQFPTQLGRRLIIQSVAMAMFSPEQERFKKYRSRAAARPLACG